MDNGLTEQQRRAIETRDVSVALSAGAGCGKTFVLTRRFLSHLAPGAEPVDLSSLVAITFTERAAREMRDRIRSECARQLRECPPEHADHWLRLVRQLDAARVFTIHAFCGSLLRANAVEAGLDPNFTQLDELTGAALRGDSVQRTVRRLLAEENEDFGDLVYEFGLEKATSLLEDMIDQQFRIDYAKWLDVTPEALVAAWRKRHEEDGIPKTLQRVSESQEAQDVLDFLSRETPTTEEARTRCGRIRELLPNLAEYRKAAWPTLKELQNIATVNKGPRTTWDKDIHPQVRDLFAALREQVKRSYNYLEFKTEHALRAAEVGLRLLRVSRQAIAGYEAAKTAEGALDFDDLLLKTRNLLRERPDVRKRAAAGISLLMVDEFQDTDPVQTEIVRNLCGDELLTGRLFFVGDHKQSIYRFRRAEPRVFHALRAELPVEGRLPLSTNFRSQPPILHFVNALFDDVLSPEYEPLAPHLPALSKGPLIEFLFSAEASGGEDGSDKGPDDPGDDEDRVEHRRGVEAEWIANRLQNLLNDETPRIRERDAKTGKDVLRRAEPKDVVLLFRAMSDVRFYEAALRKAGLDYYVVKGHAFYSQQEVYDVVNLCRAIQDVDDQISLMGVLRSPFFGLSDDSIFALWNEHRDIAAALRHPPPACLSEDQRDRIQHANLVLTELRKTKDKRPLHELLERAIALTGYDAALLAEFLGSRKLGNLHKLIDMARTLDRAGAFTLAEFVQQIQEAVVTEAKEPLAVTHPESSNVIRLMTIHASKGLEFPVVVLVDMDRRLNELPSTAVFDPELGPLVRLPEKFEQKRENPGLRMHALDENVESLAEAYRLLYVGTTRAADLLILSARMEKDGQFQSPWMKLLNRKFNTKTGQPRLPVLARYGHNLPDILVHPVKPEGPPKVDHHAERRMALAKLREAVLSAPADSWPESALPVQAAPQSFRRFSVSQLEVVDADLDMLPRGKGALFDLHDRPSGLKSKLVVHSQPGGVVRLDGREPEYLGVIVHSVLERISFQEPVDVPPLVDAAILSNEYDVSDTVRTAAVRCVEGLLKSPLAAELAAAKRCHREMEFLLRWPGEAERVVAGTMDCLFESSKGQWVLFDYKTRVLKEGQMDALLAEYEVQLGVYCLAARQLLGKLPDRVELVLIRDGLQRVTFTPTDAFLDPIAQRVTKAIAHLTTASGP